MNSRVVVESVGEKTVGTKNRQLGSQNIFVVIDSSFLRVYLRPSRYLSTIPLGNIEGSITALPRVVRDIGRVEQLLGGGVKRVFEREYPIYQKTTALPHGSSSGVKFVPNWRCYLT